MKFLTTIALLFLGTAISLAQETVKQELNCYNKWSQKFEERGAEDVADGTYTDVIITFRQGPNADCFNGKAIVKERKLQSFYIELEDGSYELVNRIWKTDANNLDIVNGISKTVVSKDNVLVNVIWPKKIKPKKAAPKKALEPTDD
jgi:hypothetical protein